MDIKVKDKWICCTDGEKIFHIIENKSELFTSTGQTKLITASTEKALMKKIFKNPKKAELGYTFLVPKSKTALSKVCVENKAIKIKKGI